MDLKFWNLQNANKGQIFVVDGLLALVFASLLILTIQSIGSVNFAKNNVALLKMQKINDLLITAQYLKIDDLETLERNFVWLFTSTPGYIKINNERKEINKSGKEKTTTISNSIKYINNSDNKIYIEIGVYN